MSAPIAISGFAHVGIRVHDLERSVRFYALFGFEKTLGPIGPDGLFVNGGYSGHGIMAGAGGSRLVVDLVTGVASADANAFRPDRTFEPREHDIL